MKLLEIFRTKGPIVAAEEPQQAQGGPLIAPSTAEAREMVEGDVEDLTLGAYVDKMRNIAFSARDTVREMSAIARKVEELAVKADTVISVNAQDAYEDAHTRSSWEARYAGMEQKFRLAFECMDGVAKQKFVDRARELNIPL